MASTQQQDQQTASATLDSVAEENTSPNTAASSSAPSKVTSLDVDTVKFGRVKVHVQGE